MTEEKIKELQDYALAKEVQILRTKKECNKLLLMALTDFQSIKLLNKDKNIDNIIVDAMRAISKVLEE